MARFVLLPALVCVFGVVSVFSANEVSKHEDINMESVDELLKISKFLNEELLNEKLTLWFGKAIKFSGFQYVGTSKKGEGYLSDIYRLKLFGKSVEDNEPVSLQIILKLIPKNEARKKSFRSAEFFKNEINFYFKVLPVMLEFQKTKPVTDPFTNVARVFACYSDGDNDFIALEDESVNNYGSAIRQEGIDLEHCKTTLKMFAKFHAISFALRDQQPKLYEEIANQLSEMYYTEANWLWYGKFWKSLANVAIDAVEKEYPNSIYVDKVKEFADDRTFKRMIDAVECTWNNGVISHGDSWITNFLFKYENNSTIPYDGKIIDFQMTRSGSPVLDLAFFFYACTTQDLRKEHFEPMLKYYHNHLAKQIRELGSDPDKVYSWNVFQEEVKKYFFFGLALSFESTPGVVLESQDVPDLNLLEGTEAINIDDIWNVKPFKTQAARLREAGNIIHCVDNGFI